MAVYIVTGKLGGGKSIATVSVINKALAKHLRVATNLNLELGRMPSCGRRAKRVRVFRVPDRPSADDIRAIGYGIEGVTTSAQAKQNYDEKRFGVIVLDECGTWLNSRDWQAEGRRELIDLLLHIRKMLWHVYFIIQDIALLDKQARKALAEHVVYCRRLDRLPIPLVGSLLGLLGDSGRVKMPKIHMTTTKYGDQPTSLTVDRSFFNGSALYDAYDTTQIFAEDYPHGVVSLVPPWNLNARTFVKSWGWRNVMRLTKIYFRQWSRTLLLASGVTLGAAAVAALRPEPVVVESEPVRSEFAGVAVPGSSERESPLVSLVYRLELESVYDPGNGGERITWKAGEQAYTGADLHAAGIQVKRLGPCRYQLYGQGGSRVVSCF